jgi:hypothetical protein
MISVITQTIIECVFTAGQTLYAVIKNRLNGQVWNGSAFEVYNSGHWASYALPLTEQSGSGYYFLARPAGVSGFLTSDTIYQQGGGSPTLGDSPATNILYGAGDNIAGIAGDAPSVSNFEAGVFTQQQGVVASGIITVSQFPTSLIDTAVNLYQGRILLMTSGAAYKSAAIIGAYNPTAGVITLTGALAAVPSIGDSFVVI